MAIPNGPMQPNAMIQSEPQMSAVAQRPIGKPPLNAAASPLRTPIISQQTTSPQPMMGGNFAGQPGGVMNSGLQAYGPQPSQSNQNMPAPGGMKSGGKVKAYAKGGAVKASSRGDGIAQRGKTKGKIY